MRSIILLLILVMIGLNGKGQSVTALPDSVLSQCCLEVTLLNGNVTTVDWVFIQYITRDGTGTKLFVEYAPNFGGIQWETQIRIQDDFDGVIERSKFIMLPFTVGSTDYAIHRNWIANIEENTTTGGTWIYGRFGTPTKRKFSAVEDYETLKNLLLACRPRAIVVAENGLYTEGDTVRMGGFLIEPTTIDANNYDFTIIDSIINLKFELNYGLLDTSFTFSRLFGDQGNNQWRFGRGIVSNTIYYGGNSDITVYSSNESGFPTFQAIATKDSLTSSFNVSYNGAGFLSYNLNQDDIAEFTIGQNAAALRMVTNDLAVDDVQFGAFHSIAEDRNYLTIETPNIDNGTARPGQLLSLVDSLSGEVEWATIDLSAYLPIADTAAMLSKYIERGDTASMLTNYPSTAGYGIVDGGKTWRADTTSPSGLATRLFAKTLPTSIAANYIATSNGSNLVARNLFDNNTYVGVLNSKPFQFGQWTTAGRPTGVTGYLGRNTTIPGIDYYNSLGAWSTLIFAATANRTYTFPDLTGTIGLLERTQTWTGTNTFQANGNNGAIYWTTSNSNHSNAIRAGAFINNPETGNWQSIKAGNEGGIHWNAGATIIQGGSSGRVGIYSGQGSSAGAFMQLYGTLAGSVMGTGQAHMAYAGNSNITNTSVSSGNIRQVIINSTINIGHANSIVATGITYDPTITGTAPGTHRFIESVRGDWYVGSTSGVMGIRTAPDPAYELKLNGDLFVQDSTRLTTTPAHTSITGLLTRDANGWVGLASLAGGLSYSGGVLTGANIYTADGTLAAGTTRRILMPSLAVGYKEFYSDNNYNTELLTFSAKNFSNLVRYRTGVDFGDLKVDNRITGSYTGGGIKGSVDFQQEVNKASQAKALTRLTTTYGNTGGSGWEYRHFIEQSMDSASTRYVNLLFSKTDAVSGGGRGHYFGIAKGNLTSTGEYNYDYTTTSFAINTSFRGNTVVQFPWLLIDNLDTDTISNRVSLYNKKYYLPNASPGSGTKIMIWTSGTPSFTTLTAATGGSSILDSLGNGSILVDANTNDLEFEDLGTFRVTQTGGNEIKVNSTEVSILGKVKAKQEGYYTITSTSSPQTLSNDYSDNLINQGGTQASFTFQFPASPADGQILTLTYNNAISTLTLDGNGNTIVGSAVTTAVAGSQRKFKFYSGIGWIKIY